MTNYTPSDVSDQLLEGENIPMRKITICNFFQFESDNYMLRGSFGFPRRAVTYTFHTPFLKLRGSPNRLVNLESSVHGFSQSPEGGVCKRKTLDAGKGSRWLYRFLREAWAPKPTQSSS